jgi:RNA polymerase sigma-70 factor, ECF subfamily
MVSTRDGDYAVEQRKDMERTDEEIVALVNGGQSEVFGELYQRHYAFVRNIVAKLIWDRPNDIEDLVQECFMKVFSNLSKFRGEAKFKTWLHTCATNIVLMDYRMVKNRPLFRANPFEVEDEDGNVSVVDVAITDSSFARTDAKRDLALVFGKMKGQRLTAVRLRYLDEYNIEESAQIMGKTIPAMKSLTHTGMGRAKKIAAELSGS